ncbi:hypothetical protein PoB_005623800 [Plakobranchus ocellatus]|uniref:Uncharacterized protein n=1 Tax=Plakobranchus ocellatus TaxID=259542 RepID=A0AAV4CE47_9GAST|nr:hypothetical protein PoB_005623800 [Plakobranchus ocellatus]
MRAEHYAIILSIEYILMHQSRCSTLERLYPRKTLESTWRPPETLWSLYSGRQVHSGVCLAAAKATLEYVWRPPD